jgi:ABC-type molybdate transport system substrate-binding protein
MSRVVRAALAGLLVLAAVAAPAGAQETVRLYAAGSLRGAMNDLAASFTQATGVKVESVYGASGLLRDRLAKGEPADVFASANMEHPAALAAAGRSGAGVMFARNRLCALAAPGLAVTSATLLERMLDPAVKLGISTPKADPSGDYAIELFAKAEGIRTGARAALEAKALQLTGGPNSPPPPADRSAYGMLVAEGKADLFLTYCTNAEAARAENTRLSVVAVPEPLAVGASYGLTQLNGAGPAASRLVQYVLGDEGQRILARYGFAPPAKP